MTMTTPCIAGLSSPAVERWVWVLNNLRELVMLEALKDSVMFFARSGVEYFTFLFALDAMNVSPIYQETIGSLGGKCRYTYSIL